MRRAVTGLLREHRVGEDDSSWQQLSVGEMIARGALHDAKNNTQIEATAWRRVLEYEREGMSKATVESDAAQTLRVLRQSGFQLAVLTNNARPATLDALEKFALDSYFDLILTRDEVAMKPDPAGILTARSTLQATRVFHVGDAWLDGAAANHAKVPFIAFRAQPEAFEGREITVWKTVQQLGELPALLRSNNRED